MTEKEIEDQIASLRASFHSQMDFESQRLFLKQIVLLDELRAVISGVRHNSITGKQVRAARASLNWTIVDLAKRANVGVSTVQAVEKVDGEPTVSNDLQWRIDVRAEALVKIRNAFEQAGVWFREGGMNWL